MIKVSIIIPVYNTGLYLKQCLKTVCNQTLKDIEIICINDCSTDGSLEILYEYAKNDNRIKIIDFKENKGVSAARNEGIKAARGEYIGFVDSDDWIDLDFYEKLYCPATETDVDIIKGNLKHYSSDKLKSVSSLNNFIRKGNSKLYFYTNFCTAIYNKVFLAENNIKFDEQRIFGEDILFLNKSILATQKHIPLVDDVFYYYNRRENSGDSLFLDFEKIKSGIIVYNQMTKNILDANIMRNFTSESLNFILTSNLNAVVKLCSRCLTKDVREYCIDNIISIYNLIAQYISENSLDFSEEYIAALKNNDKDQLKKLHEKYNTEGKILTASLRTLYNKKKNNKKTL